MTNLRHDRFRKLDRRDFDVVVVGAGVGGLTAAALLAQRGRSVLVLDRHYLAGGNATIFKRPGYEFDVGVHYVGQCGSGGPLPRILESAGARVKFTPMDPDGFDTLLVEGSEFRVPIGLDAYRERLVAHFPAEREGIDRYVRFLQGAEAIQKTVQSPRQGLRGLGTHARGALTALRWVDSTLGQFLDTCTRDPALRTVLAGEAGTYAEPPSRASLALHAALMLHYLEQGGFYPEGGGQVMADELAASIERSGGKLLLSSRVTEILVENGRAVGVSFENKHLGPTTVRARAVISNADIKRTFLSLVKVRHWSGRALKRAKSWEMAPALGVAYLGVKREVFAKLARNTNYWVYPHTDLDALYDDARAGRMTSDPMVYATIASLKDPTNPRLAPPGVINLQLMTIAPSQPSAWGVSDAHVQSGEYSESERYLAEKMAFATRMKRVAEQALPGLGQSVIFEEVATPLTHSRYTLSTGGTSYGLALIPSQFLHRRPGAKTEIEGLYLCGASCQMGHGILGSMVNGVVAAAALAGREVFTDAMAGRRAARSAAPGVAGSPAPAMG